jgi:ArsR family transcriptional regulator
MHMLPDTLFHALVDSTRLRCLLLLQAETELCVCELTHALDAPQPKVSRHLAQLREANIVSDRRNGLWVYYRLHPDLPVWALRVIEATSLGAAGESPYAEDRDRLDNMPNRPARTYCA